MQSAPPDCNQAILDADEEWSQHRKLYSTDGCVRGSIPPGFPYFCAGFDLGEGLAHVIENEQVTPELAPPSASGARSKTHTLHTARIPQRGLFSGTI